MNFITDYQLDIDKGFHYKIQDRANKCQFHRSKTTGLWYINGFTLLSRALDIDLKDLLKKFTNCKIIDDIFYCNSKEQCCDICQHIVDKYFKPIDISKETKEWCERSRRYLTKYYADDESYVILNNVQWNLIWDQSRNVWWYHSVTNGVSEYFTQFELKTAKEVINLCSSLGISAKYTSKVEFDSRQDAIKFTDYLIETYIIKKEKTYENQLRKERATIRGGAKPAGSIIHGRRSKASIRCGCIEHKACLGN